MQNQPHVFELYPSKIYIAFQAVLFFLSFILITLLDIHWLWRVLICVFLFGYAAPLFFQKALLRGLHVITAVKYQEGQWFLKMNDAWFSVTLLGDSTVTSFVSVLKCRLQHSKKIVSTTIFCDALSKNHYRQLLIALRLFNREQPVGASLSRQSQQK